MIQKTYKELVELDQAVGELYKKTPDLVNTKFGYAYKKFSAKNLKEVFNDYGEELSGIRIDNASVDEKTKTLLIAPTVRGFQYSKEGLKAVIKAERELEKKWESKVFDVESYIVKAEDLPELTENQLEIMKGIIVE